MSSLMTIKLNKHQGMSWGFRLQGGKDFATPLCIQKVNVGSVAEKAGLAAGDAVVSIGGQDALNFRHKEAQDTIVRSGNSFDLVIQRGMQTWRPTVSVLPQVKSTPEGVFATSTSLAATPQKPYRYLGSNYNSLPRPYPGNSSSVLNGRHSSDSSTCEVKPVSLDFLQDANRPSSPNSRFNTPTSPTRNTRSNGFHSPSHQPVSSGVQNNSVSNSDTSIIKNIWSKYLDIDAATSELKIAGTEISLDKEKAKNFLLITLDKEAKAYETAKNPARTPPNLSRVNRSSSIGTACSTFNKPKDIRKYSFGSNCSSMSSASSHDGDAEGFHGLSSTTGPDKQHLVNAQFNSPINLYSEDSIAETLSAQAEILGQGVLGVNFMKNDKNFDGKSSDVLRMVQEMDSEPSHQVDSPVPFPSQSFSPVGGPTAAQLQPGENICFGCQRLIIGVFVRIKNKNLHAECFKCATCGSSLKNVGYYNINEKLYCDIHAKQAARHNPPAPNMVPITVQPGQVPPTGAMTSPQARVSSPFQPKSPVPAPALAPMQAPASAPAPVLPEPIMQELPTPESVHVPEPQLPDPLPEPQPIVEVSEEMPTLPEELEPVHVQEVRAPALAPSVPKPSPIAPAPVVVPNLQTSVNPQAFGALAGGVDVRSHIPKKDVPAMNFVQSSMQNPAQPAVNIGVVDSMPKPSPLLGMSGSFTKPGSSARGVQAPGHRSAPRRGRGVMNQASASRIPVCSKCQRQIRGPFISALGKTWCPDHFICATETCRRAIIEMGFVEEQGRLYCENCYESYLAPICGKCDKRIKGDCLNAVGKQFHPECFCCAYCGKVFGSGAFYLEDGLPYCETDWNDLFTTKCVGCNFPIEAGDRWVEALNSNYHSQCFKCSVCKSNLEGKSFYAKNGRPFCKTHAGR